jgi:rubrerythrin
VAFSTEEEGFMNTIDYAIGMELEGHEFYTELADSNKDNELHTVFLLLAESELQHAELLKRFREKANIKLEGHFARPEFRSVFTEEQFQRMNSPKQLDAYRFAYEREEESIKLYQSMKMGTDNELEKEIYDFLIRQEEEHLTLFEELVKMVTRPEEWVESAEFGIREEY